MVIAEVRRNRVRGNVEDEATEEDKNGRRSDRHMRLDLTSVVRGSQGVSRPALCVVLIGTRHRRRAGGDTAGGEQFWAFYGSGSRSKSRRRRVGG